MRQSLRRRFLRLEGGVFGDERSGMDHTLSDERSGMDHTLSDERSGMNAVA
jgi:hypothetical protein